MLQEMLNFGTNTGEELISDQEATYLQGKIILDDIISSASANPALFLNSIQSYFHLDLEMEFLRKCR
jgi:hypothetical protein